MSGQMVSFDEKQRIADEFIERTNPYRPYEPLEFNLRDYLQYLEDHNIDNRHIPNEVMQKFQ